MRLRGWSKVGVLSSLLVPCVASLGCGRHAASFDRGMAEMEIRAIEDSWAQVAVSGDPKVAETILADGFIGVSPGGAHYTKGAFIDDTKAHPLGFTSNVLGDVKVRFYGETAVAQGSETFTKPGGEKARFVWTDVLVRQRGAWRIVAAQDAVAPALAEGEVDGAGGPPGPALAGASLFTSAEAASDKARIDTARNAYAAAWAASNAEAVTGQYTPDAIVMYPNQPPLHGSAEILPWFRDFFARFPRNEFALESAEIVINGDWAYDRGTYRWKGSPRSGGAPEEDHGKYLMILRRQRDGSFRVARDSDNSDRPAAQATRGER